MEIKLSQEQVSTILDALESHKNTCDGMRDESFFTEEERKHFEVEFQKATELEKYIRQYLNS